MTIILCPSNCEHGYEFPHTIVIRMFEHTTMVFVICRSCGHWISRKHVRCFCEFECHDKTGGFIVVKNTPGKVESS